MSIVDEVVGDLEAQSAELDDLVATLDEAGWTRPTPAPGWTIAHQIAHLMWTDDVAAVACTDPEEFGRLVTEAAPRAATFVDEAAETGAALPPARLLADWRAARARLAAALREVPEGTKVPWFGPPMSAASMATARLMETWAHGLDVADALGVRPEVTDRIRGVVHIGVRTRDFAYMVNGMTPPAAEFRFEIDAPSGSRWVWGPDDATDIIRGSALDFCELVTQRRALDDLDLDIVGDQARTWASIAQCFAGPPGGGRPSTSEGH